MKSDVQGEKLSSMVHHPLVTAVHMDSYEDTLYGLTKYLGCNNVSWVYQKVGGTYWISPHQTQQ
jgi:hypothetical protein